MRFVFHELFLFNTITIFLKLLSISLRLNHKKGEVLLTGDIYLFEQRKKLLEGEDSSCWKTVSNQKVKENVYSRTN